MGKAGRNSLVLNHVMGFDKGITIVKTHALFERFGLLCIRQYNVVGALG